MEIDDRSVSKRVGSRIRRLLQKAPEVLVPSAERMSQFERCLEVGSRVLDVGTGSGILSEMAFRKGAVEVTAIDINRAAVKAAGERVPRAKVLLSDLFENVEGDFDTIIFAAPWSEGVVKKPFDHALYDNGVTARFLQDAGRYLRADGFIWLEYSDAFPDNFQMLNKLIAANGFVIEQQWSYQDWGKLVKREVGVYLYKIRVAS